MALKRKASSVSPSKRVTRSTPAIPAEDTSSSDDELDIIQPVTPSKRPRKKAQVIDSPSTRSPRKTVQFVEQSPSKLRASPRKNTQLKTPSLTPPVEPSTPQRSSSRPNHSEDSFNAQRRAVLCALQRAPIVSSADDDNEYTTNEIAVKELEELLQGTVERGQGNSCLLLGPRGSGKTRIIETCIANLKQTPIVVRLSGWVQTNDRLAMKELSRQLSTQVSPSLLPEEIHGAANDNLPDGDDDENPFLDAPDETGPIELSVPTAHMHSLIACIPTLGRPTIIVVDAFDLFTNHPRQSLLYSLLDTVQNCRGAGNKGLAVVGVTTRLETITGLEKRVKSRFSGRMIRTAGSNKVDHWKRVARAMLMPAINGGVTHEFSKSWKKSVDEFLDDAKTTRLLEEACSISDDVKLLARLLISSVLNLKPNSPWLTSSQLEHSVETQRSRPDYPYIHTLNYPSLCLLLAFYQAESDGYPTLTFEMMYEYVRNAIRVSSAAPVQLNGGGIGMTRCSRAVLWATFEQLIAAQIFVPLTAPSTTIGKNFLKYRCSVDREDVKKGVEKNGNTSLKTFLKRAVGSH